MDWVALNSGLSGSEYLEYSSRSSISYVGKKCNDSVLNAIDIFDDGVGLKDLSGLIVG